MAAEIGDPTGDTGTGAEITAIGNLSHSITGTARDLLADMVEVETGTTAEAAVREGYMVQTPTPPHQDRQKTRGDGQTGCEGGRSV